MKLKYTFLIFLFGFLSNASFATQISSPLMYIKQDFDVLHYNAQIEFSSSQRRLIYANNEITIKWLNKSDTNRFYFHLRNLSVDKVEYNGHYIEFETVGKPTDATFHYAINRPADDNKDTAIVKVYYHGIMQNEGGTSPWGGVHDQGVVFALGVGFYCNYISTTQHWLACYDHPSDKATYKFTFINPLSNFIVSNGNYQKTITNDGKIAYVYSSDKPVATYLMTFADYNYTEHTINYKFPIRIYSMSKYDTLISKVFANLPKIIDIYEKLFGEYPFEMLGYVLTPIGSMESQMMINLDEFIVKNFQQNPELYQLTIAHELSHQWFGNSVTPFDFRDAYLNESWATYCESLFLEEFQGKEAYLNEQSLKLMAYINTYIKKEGALPLYDYSRKPPSSNYPVTIYYKGALVLGMLRYLLTNGTNDRIFFDFVKDYLSKFKYGNINTEEFKKLLYNYHPKDEIDKFFENWIYKIGYPQFDVKLIINNNLKEGKYKDIVLRQNNPKNWGIFDIVPIPLRFVKDKSEWDTVVWIKHATANEISLSELINNPNMQFDTVYFNHGNTTRSLFAINSIKTENPSSIDTNANPISFKLENKSIIINTTNQINQAKVIIYNLLGQPVLTSVFDSNNKTIDLSNLPPGFYNFVVVQNNIYLHINKFILN